MRGARGLSNASIAGSVALVLSKYMEHKQNMVKLEEERRRALFEESQKLAGNQDIQEQTRKLEQLEARTRDIEQRIEENTKSS